MINKTKAASSDGNTERSTTPDKHMTSTSKMDSSFVGHAPVSPITEEITIRQLEQARKEVEHLIKDDSADETVRKAAVRKLKQAELQYQSIVFSQAQVRVHEVHHQSDQTARTIPDSSSKAGADNKKVTTVHNVGELEHNPILTNDPVELARIASDDAAFLEQHQNMVDESVVKVAVHKAERSPSQTGDARSNSDSERVNEPDDEETSSGFEDSSLLEPFQTNGQKVTIEVIPISDHIDLEALGQAISEVECEEKWLKSRRIIKAAVGSKLVLRLNKAVTVKEVDRICDRLTDEFPDDIQSLEVKFHPNLL